MTKLKKYSIFIISALAWFFIIPEIIFGHLSEESYLHFASLTNPFNIFGSSTNSLIVSIIILPLLLAGATVFIAGRLFFKK